MGRGLAVPQARMRRPMSTDHLFALDAQCGAAKGGGATACEACALRQWFAEQSKCLQQRCCQLQLN